MRPPDEKAALGGAAHKNNLHHQAYQFYRPAQEKSAESIARALHGRRNGNGWMVRCVAHDDGRPSLSIADGDDGRLLVHCFAGCDPLAVLAALRCLGLYESTGAVTAPYRAPRVRKATSDALAWSARAESIWQATLPLTGTPAEAYLRSRKCHIPASGDLRFLPAGGV